MIKNENNKVVKIDNLNIILNFSNGAVVGVDETGLQQYLDCEKNNGEFKDLELKNFLIENSFISEKFIKNNKKILSAYLHVTNRCNLHCIGCYSSNNDRNVKQDLPLEKFKKIILGLKKIGLENMVISGGETLLYKDILPLLKFSRKDCEIENIILITNGTIGNYNLYKKLSNYLNTIAVSIDTFSTDCPTFLRDEGIYDRIINNINIMQKAGLNVSLLPTLHHKNTNHIDDYLKLAKILGTEISFSILTTPNSKEFKEFTLTDEDLKIIANHIINNDIVVHDAPVDEILEAKLSCEGGSKMIAISSSGKVYPCHMLMEDEFLMGDACIEPISEIIYNSSFSCSVDEVCKCKECEYKYFCGGACRARAFMRSGDIKSSDPFCILYKMYYSAIFKKIKDKIYNEV